MRTSLLLKTEETQTKWLQQPRSLSQLIQVQLRTLDTNWEASELFSSRTLFELAVDDFTDYVECELRRG